MDDRVPASESLLPYRTIFGRLLAKLNARDRAYLVIIAYENGLITPGKT